MPLDGKTFLINSENRVSGSTSSFSYYIPNEGNWTHALVLGCNIPVSYYLVQSPFNVFTLYEEEGVPIQIQIPDGNYNVQSFKTVVQTLLNNASTTPYTYTITFENEFSAQSTGLYTYNITPAPVGYLPRFVFHDGSELHMQFGFPHASTNIFDANGTMISSNVVNFIPENTLHIWSDLVQDTNLITLFSDNTVPYSNISFQSQSEIYSKRLNQGGKDNLFNFSLLSGSGQHLNLNGLPILLNILLYKEEDKSYQESIKNYIKYKVSS